ncbi:MAG: hypothetical protein OXG47_02955, partial [bacterium]|nr:hypothetical protein [bacterium]
TTHQQLSEADLAATGVSADMVRLSVGLEWERPAGAAVSPDPDRTARTRNPRTASLVIGGYLPGFPEDAVGSAMNQRALQLLGGPD